jgi:hypothetical protein
MVSLHHQKSIVVAHIYLEENVMVTRDTKWLQDKVCMLCQCSLYTKYVFRDLYQYSHYCVQTIV